MKKITNAIIFVVIGVILAVGVMTPILAGMEDQVVTEKNNTTATYRMTDKETIIRNIDNVAYVNATPITDIVTGRNVRVVTDDFLMESQYNQGTETQGAWFFMRFDTSLTVDGWATVHFNKGTYQILDASNAVMTEGSYTHLLVPSTQGDYTESSANFHINGNQEFYVVGTGSTITLYAGTIGNVNVISTNATETPSITVTSELIQEETELYKVSSITISDSYRTSYVPITYKEVTSENAAVRSIIMMLPILISVMLIVAVVYNVIDMKRNEF